MTRKLEIRVVKHDCLSCIFPKDGKLIVMYRNGVRLGIHLYYLGPSGVSFPQVAEHFKTPSEEVIGGAIINLHQRVLKLSGGSSEYGNIPQKASPSIRDGLKKYLEKQGINIMYTDISQVVPFDAEDRNAEIWRNLGFEI